MITIRCDGCGVELVPGALRYTVRINVHAAYDELEVGLLDLVRNHKGELLDLIDRLENKDAKELEEAVYKGITLDLCPACQRAYIRSPLRFHPEQGASEREVDIDGFLRSLGYGSRRDEEKDREEP